MGYRRLLAATVNGTANSTCTYMKATSDGAWTGERPIDYGLPLLIIQLVLVVVFSRIFAFILKPLRQPRVIAEILVRASQGWRYRRSGQNHGPARAPLSA